MPIGVGYNANFDGGLSPHIVTWQPGNGSPAGLGVPPAGAKAVLLAVGYDSAQTTVGGVPQPTNPIVLTASAGWVNVGSGYWNWGSLGPVAQWSAWTCASLSAGDVAAGGMSASFTQRVAGAPQFGIAMFSWWNVFAGGTATVANPVFSSQSGGGSSGVTVASPYTVGPGDACYVLLGGATRIAPGAFGVASHTTRWADVRGNGGFAPMITGAVGNTGIGATSDAMTFAQADMQDVYMTVFIPGDGSGSGTGGSGGKINDIEVLGLDAMRGATANDHNNPQFGFGIVKGGVYLE